jgi:uncharacterized protein YneF (UPF0154 family)
MGFIVLIVFIVFVFACLFSFIGGWFLGRKQAAAEYAEELRMKERSEKDFREIKRELNKGKMK